MTQNDDSAKIETLIQQVLNGESASFNQIVDRFNGCIYCLAYRILRNPDDAEDVRQETLINAYTRLASFNGNSKFSTWLYKICTNLCFERLRERSNEWLGDPKLKKYLSEHKSLASPEDGYVEAAQIRHYLNLLARFDGHPGHQIAQLKYWRGLSWNEVAAVTGKPEETCKSQLKVYKGLVRSLEPKERD